MNLFVDVVGTDLKFEVVKTIPIRSEMVSIHFDQLSNGKWQILYNAEYLPNFNQIEAFVVKREGDSRFIVLKGIDIELELSTSTAVRVRPNLMHLDKLWDGTWRLTYNALMIPDFTKVIELTMTKEEDVL